MVCMKLMASRVSKKIWKKDSMDRASARSVNPNRFTPAALMSFTRLFASMIIMACWLVSNISRYLASEILRSLWACWSSPATVSNAPLSWAISSADENTSGTSLLLAGPAMLRKVDSSPFSSNTTVRLNSR